MSGNSHALPNNLISKEHSRQLSIDCGISHSKLIYFDRETIFKTDIFPTGELAQQFKRLENVWTDLTEISVTGRKQNYAKSIVTTFFSGPILYVDESEAFSLGFSTIIKHLREFDVLYKVSTNITDKDIIKLDIDNPVFKKFKEKMDSDFADIKLSTDEKIKRPSILIWGGVSVQFYWLKEDETIELVGSSLFGGATYRGLSKCLCDSNNYQNITNLAHEGRRENVDTQVYEIFNEDPKSPYGKFPPQMPIFAFGKCSDYLMNKEDLNTEDTMASWSYLLLADIMSVAGRLCLTYKVNSIYLGGGLFNAPVFSKMVEIRRKTGFIKMETAILDCNYVSALGALLKL